MFWGDNHSSNGCPLGTRAAEEMVLLDSWKLFQSREAGEINNDIHESWRTWCKLLLKQPHYLLEKFQSIPGPDHDGTNKQFW